MATTVRICICGDESTGKSSLIASLVKDTLPPSSIRITSVLPPITIPPSESPLHALTSSSSTLPPQDVSASLAYRISQYPTPTTTLIDTSPLPHLRPTLRLELRRANVILLVYSDHYSYERVALFWLPYFRSLGVNVPVVLCANKSDLLPSSPRRSSATSSTGSPLQNTHQSLDEEFLPLMSEFKEIDSCIRTSAKDSHNVNEVFYLCQKASTHPIAPLFDSKDSSLKPSCITALRRIFYLSDHDHDGYLSDLEMHAFQERCFHRPISTSDLNEIKHALSRSDSTLDLSSGLPLRAFLLLQELYCLKGRHETLWTILQTFHYTATLSLAPAYISPSLPIPAHSSTELSPAGYRFFVDLFLLFDKDNDGGLSPEELSLLFNPCPSLPPSWDADGGSTTTAVSSNTVCNEAGHITLQGWLALWSMTTFQEPKTTLEYLAWLGFESQPGTTIGAIKITKPRKRRRGRAARVERNVLLCYLLGAPGSGKSALMDAFLNRPFTGVYRPTINPRTAVNSVEVGGGKQCYLILEEHGTPTPFLLSNPPLVETADLIAYTYDSSDPDSFASLVELRKAHPHLESIPSIFVALKADLDRSTQRTPLQPSEYTTSLRLPAPLHVSVTWNSISELFVQLAEAAMVPSSALPAVKEGEGGISGALGLESDSGVWIAGGVGVVAALAVTGVIWRRWGV